MSPNRKSAAPSPGASRRRGEALESALLQAAWDELVASGYQGLTFEAVAERAHTSRPVIARRWPTRAELVLAAVGHHSPSIARVADTGTVRGDVLLLLRAMRRRYAEMAGIVGFLLTESQQRSAPSLAELRDRMLARGPQDSVMDVILRAAAARGEVDLERVTPRTRAVAVDLMRHELIMRQGEVPERAQQEIVDEIFLPLLRVQAGTGPGPT